MSRIWITDNKCRQDGSNQFTKIRKLDRKKYCKLKDRGDKETLIDGDEKNHSKKMFFTK